MLTNIESSRRIFEKFSNIIYMKIRPAGTELFHVEGQKDGQTNMKKLIVAFRNFDNAPKIYAKISMCICCCCI